MSELLTLTQAARLLQREGRHAAQWLRRELLAREKRSGESLLVRVGRGTRRPTYKVNLALLRLRCPDLFDARDPLGKVIERSAVVGRGIERKVDELLERQDELDAKVGLLAEAIRGKRNRLS